MRTLIKDIVSKKYTKTFDYEEVVGVYIALNSKFTISNDVAIIYTLNSMLQFEIEKTYSARILLKLQKIYPNIKKVLVKIDKRGLVKSKLDKIEFKKSVQKIEINEEELKKDYRRIENLKFDEVTEKYFKQLALKYHKNNNISNICSNCNEKVELLIDGLCSYCKSQEFEEVVREYMKIIKENPYKYNNSLAYEYAKDRILVEKEKEIMKYFMGKYEDSKLDVLIYEYAKLECVSCDETLIRLNAVKMKERIEEWKKNIKKK